MPTIEENVSSEPPAMPTTEETQLKKPTPKYRFRGHDNQILDFVFLRDNIHVVSGSLDGVMCKWNCDTGLLVGEPWSGEGGTIHALALSPDGRMIACGREDGSVQRWNTEGKMMEGIWTGHSDLVRSLSWSPNGNCISSGSDDETILIRKVVESGEIEVGPIKTGQGGVLALAYSPLGDKIASGGKNLTICIWDSKTGELVVSIEDLGHYVWSVVWSLDSTKLYAALGHFARVFDSNSGAELRSFEHNHPLISVALSPKQDVLACVGIKGIARLWDTRSCQPLGDPFNQEDGITLRVAFSPDGKYVAYGGTDNTITLWVVREIAPELPSPPPSCLEADATTHFAQSGSDEYGDFFQSYHPSASLGPSRPSKHPHESSARRFLNIFIPFRHLQTTSESIVLHQRPQSSFFGRHSEPQPVTIAAGRKTKRRWIARPLVKTNSQAGQSSSATIQPAAQPHSMPQPQAQATAQQPAQEDHGCWGNFCLALGCIPQRPLPAVSSPQPATL